MNIKYFTVVVCLAMLGAAPVSAADREQIIADVQKSFDGFKTLKAKFTQTTKSKGFGQVSKGKGQMTLKKPAMMRWEYSEPEGLLVVVDGEKLWNYDPADNTAYFERLDGFFSPKSPALFLAGEEPLESLFNISLAKPGKNDTLNIIVLKLIPKEPQAGLKGMLLKVDGGSYEIAEIVIVDHLGNRNSLVFTDIDRQAEPDPSLFTFTPPEGVAAREISRKFNR